MLLWRFLDYFFAGCHSEQSSEYHEKHSLALHTPKYSRLVLFVQNCLVDFPETEAHLFPAIPSILEDVADNPFDGVLEGHPKPGFFLILELKVVVFDDDYGHEQSADRLAFLEQLQMVLQVIGERL